MPELKPRETLKGHTNIVVTVLVAEGEGKVSALLPGCVAVWDWDLVRV